MNALDVILFVFFALFVFYLVIVAATEPRYTWRAVATLEEVMQEFSDSLEHMKELIGTSLVPAFLKCSREIESAAQKMGKIDGQTTH